MRERPLRTPASPGELFQVFNRMALQGFGGVMAIAQHELVEREAWMTPDRFVEMLSLAQVLPGPNIINLALMIGDAFFGWRGMAAAIGGLLLAPLAIVLGLAVLVGRLGNAPAVTGALRGMGAVAAGLVLTTACRLAPTLRRSPLGPASSAAAAAITFIATALLRWPLWAVVLGLGSFSIALAWRRLGR